MLANSRYHKQARRGIVLVLVLAMLSLLALIGVTFATFSGQAKVNARLFAQSVIASQDDELMDWALAQLITDTGDPRSVLHGHSLARDMFGNDAFTNGYLPFNPTTGTPFYITRAWAASNGIYNIAINVQSNDANFYGYSFTGWIIRLTYSGTPANGGLTNPSVPSQYQPPGASPTLPPPTGATGMNYATPTATYPVTQTFEVTGDSGYAGGTPTNRVLQIAVLDPLPTANTSITGQTVGAFSTDLINWTQGTASQLPSTYLLSAIASAQSGVATFSSPYPYALSLDGRWLRAFNGPGMGSTNSYFANFRYNNVSYNGQPSLGVPGPNSVGMDEDYDACDLENWFLALQSADGRVMIPSFHRPGIIRYDPNNANAPINDWQRLNYDGPPTTPGGAPTSLWASSAARILRPCQADGNDPTTFRDLTPDINSGQVTYDVDNDGDGVTDSVWLDLGYPPYRDSRGQLQKPLFAFMVIGLNGRIPLNTAGNLAGQNSTTTNITATYAQTEHLGNSVSEIDPTYGLQNAYQGPGIDKDPFNVWGNGVAVPGTYPFGTGGTYWGSPTSGTLNTQADNAVDANLADSTNTTAPIYGFYYSMDVRLIQLRNLLSGTRPQPTPLVPLTTANAANNGDDNIVYGSFAGGGSTGGQPYLIPNSIADLSDNPSGYTDPSGNILVQRTSSPVAGRWGEAPSIPGVPFVNPNPPAGLATAPPPANLLQTNYNNPVRAGYSFDVADLIIALNNGTAGNAYDSSGNPLFPRDAADDNLNAFDVYPVPTSTLARLGEVGDADFYDPVGALLLPVERMRRFVTPADINGSGRVAQYTGTTTGSAIRRGSYLGADSFGRVQFSSYFRPAGSPGVIGVNYTYDSTTTTPSYNPVNGLLGAIYFPQTPAPTAPSAITDATAPPYNQPSADPFYSSGPNTGVATYDPTTGTALTTPVSPLYWPYYLPDMTNNPFHGFESYKVPNLLQNPGYTTPGASYKYPGYSVVQQGGMPIDQNALSSTSLTTALTTEIGSTGTVPSPVPSLPTEYPTYDTKVNSSGKLDGVNEADEMNLYGPNPLLDSPYQPSDLEWLYRQQDVDGATLSSRLSQLAPISFTNTIDGLRRRRLYSTDTWELNNFVWASDNPGNTFPYNSRFAVGQNASLSRLRTNVVASGGTFVLPALMTPSLAHRDKKINLNYPLPVSNDCNEPVRQKWISDTYQLLKATLPPDSVDTAEELAQLSQFVINIVDFRDPDATMTHWVNPDVILTPSTAAGSYPTLTRNNYNGISTLVGLLDQYGMEYCPVAINEVLAYQLRSRPTSSSTTTYTNRFFIELVNTLTAAYNPNYDYTAPTDPNNFYGTQASTLDLGGFNYVSAPPTTSPGPSPAPDPYGGGCWDLVFAYDSPGTRPDPYRGELVANSTGTPFYGLIPLNRDALSQTSGGTGGANAAAPNEGDATLIPLNPAPFTAAALPSSSTAFPSVTPPTTYTGPPINYFYVIGNTPTAGTEVSPPSATTTSSGTTAPPYSSVTQFLATGFDPFTGSAGPTGFVWRPGILPGLTAAPTGTSTNYQWDLPRTGLSSSVGTTLATTGGGTSGSALYYWVCLRRPANPFAPVSATNPMCVVDSMRFPYIDGSPVETTATPGWAMSGTTWYTTGAANPIFSSQRLQPYRGGHAVPMPIPPTSTTTTTLSSGATIANQPPDPRYGYSDQIARNMSASSNYGYASTSASSFVSTNYIYHTLGSANDAAEAWDYFVFNDRDFTSVAELMLVPGCPPGLFTKQFVEFAPSQINAFNIFSAVTPVITPSYGTYTSGTGSSATSATIKLSGTTTTANSISPLTAFNTATAPFLSVSSVSSIADTGSAGLEIPSSVTMGTATYSNYFYPVTATGYTAPGPGITTVPNFDNTGSGNFYATTSSGSTPIAYKMPTTVPTPIQPHTYPYLVDKFFYTGASNFLYPPLVGPNSESAIASMPALGRPGTTDPSYGPAAHSGATPASAPAPVVGGPAADGWFKMFDFFEVPSQSNGSTGPVAIGANFDWARQDTKPGLMNLNLIIDEEAFFAVFGRQSSTFTQTYLNGIELPTWYGASPPYTLPLSNWTNGGPAPAAPIPFTWAPMPLVVTAVQANGAPNYVYPLVDQYGGGTQQGGTQQGYLALDPIQTVINNFQYSAAPPIPPGVGNRIKAAFAQFLWLRHGGSGYLFGFGQGSTGQNVSVATTVSGQANTGPIPAERPFHSLSYPDINFTIMRPAALPPSATSNPVMTYPNPILNAQAMIHTAVPASGWYFLNSQYGSAANYYAPYLTGGNTNFGPFTPGSYAGPIVLTGDPGVRNPFFTQGYASSDPNIYNINGTQLPPYPPYDTTANQNSVPAGQPLPVNLAFPNAYPAGWPTTAPPNPALDTMVLPPVIPPVRLFQPPDAYGAGAVMAYGYDGINLLPPPMSNATDSGDPWINNQIPNVMTGAGAPAPIQYLPPYNNGQGSPVGLAYALNNGFSSLVWPWVGVVGTNWTGSSKLYGTGAEYGLTFGYSGGPAPYPPNPATGVLPLVSALGTSATGGMGTVLPTAATPTSLNFNSTTNYLGSSGGPASSTGVASLDDRAHPYWRSEMLQKAMNLTTVRTHQYAVWITIGFFEVKKQGDIGMILQGNPQLAYDVMGPEVGTTVGKGVRYRGFFIVDRLKLTGYNHSSIGGFRAAILYRKIIQ